MAHGKIRVNTLTYDTGSGDVDVAISTIPTATQLAAKASLGATQTFTKAQRGDIVDVTGATPSFDLNAANNFRFTTSANWTSFTLANLATAAEGQTGSIFIVYGGAHSGNFPTTMKFVGGAAGLGNLSSASGKIDRIDYIVLNSTTVTCTLTKDYIA